MRGFCLHVIVPLAIHLIHQRARYAPNESVTFIYVYLQPERIITIDEYIEPSILHNQHAFCLFWLKKRNPPHGKSPQQQQQHRHPFKPEFVYQDPASGRHADVNIWPDARCIPTQRASLPRKGARLLGISAAALGSSLQIRQCRVYMHTQLDTHNLSRIAARRRS